MNMVLNVHRNHKAYYGRGEEGKGYRGGRRGRLYTHRYTVTTRMTPALRREAMRAILMFHELYVASALAKEVETKGVNQRSKDVTKTHLNRLR